MKLLIRKSKPEDLEKYTMLLQTTYASAYADDSIRLTKECFSKEVFLTQNTQKYLKSNLKNTDKQRTLVATIDNKLVGAITLENINDSEANLRGFYVLPEHQREGIGKQLWSKVLEFAEDRVITLDTYSHNKKTIKLYKKWGFEIDFAKEKFFRHWPEWPEDLQAECIYMRYENKQ